MFFFHILKSRHCTREGERRTATRSGSGGDETLDEFSRRIVRFFPPYFIYYIGGYCQNIGERGYAYNTHAREIVWWFSLQLLEKHNSFPSSDVERVERERDLCIIKADCV